jgi:prefoldin subunit 5
MYKEINEFKEDTNKQLNKVRKTMQDMKEELQKRYRNPKKGSD